MIASNAPSGPIPLPPGTIGLSIKVWRDLGDGPAGEALSRAPQIEFGRSTT